jgi:hypothetical protein
MPTYQVISVAERLQDIVRDGHKYNLTRYRLEREIIEFSLALFNYAERLSSIEVANEAMVKRTIHHVN